MGKEKETVAPSKFKAQLRVHSQETSTVVRLNGMPMITDKTDKSVVWLAANGFKAEQIEIIGEKPANWDAVFNPPVAEAPAPAPVAENVPVEA